MNLGDLLRGALVEIRAHKTRSLLTCLSLTVGVAAALYTLSQTASTNKRYSEGMALMGPGRLEVRKKDGYASRGLSHGLTIQDSSAIRERFPELYMVSPLARRWHAKFALGAYHTDNMMYLGVTDEWRKREWVYKTEGRFFNAGDVRRAARVCVLLQHGGWFKKPFWAKYFPESPYDGYLKKRALLGKYVSVEGRPFLVIGILKEPPRDLDPRWGHSSWGEDGQILVPVTTFRQYLANPWDKNPDALDRIIVDTADAATSARYLREISALLLFRHRNERDFDVKDYRELMAGAIEQMRKSIAAIAAIGVVAMLAGGIGILNVTLATVFSRVREIGVRRALGASRRDIVAQFVAEALILGAISGAAGSALGAVAVVWLSPNERQVASFSLMYAGASTLIAVAVSFVFSVGPAWQASRLDPMIALRYE